MARMTIRHPLLGALFLLTASACSSQSANSGGGRTPQGEGTGAPSGETSEASTGAEGSPASTGEPGAGPAAAAETKEKEAPKDENALVLELTVKGKELDDAARSAMEKEAREFIAKSAKLALTDKGIKSPRHVAAILTAEPIKGDKKGFTVMLGITGVTKNGNCPLFDLDQKLTMEGGKKENAADVGQLRSAALKAILEELEQKSPTLKPNANCTPYK